MALQKQDPLIPVMLEVLPGFFFHVFGLGHLYQGRLGMGLFIFASYWTLQAINVFLALFLIGFITGPLTWLFYMVAAPLNAADSAKARQLEYSY